MYLEKKNKRNIMLEAFYRAKHLIALEKKDEKAAQDYLDMINKLSE